MISTFFHVLFWYFAVVGGLLNLVVGGLAFLWVCARAIARYQIRRNSVAPPSTG